MEYIAKNEGSTTCDTLIRSNFTLYVIADDVYTPQFIKKKKLCPRKETSSSNKITNN